MSSGDLARGHGAPRRSAAGDAERAAHPGGGDHDDRGGDVRVQAADQGGGRDERAAHAATSQDGGGGGISFKKRRRLPQILHKVRFVIEWLGTSSLFK